MEDQWLDRLVTESKELMYKLGKLWKFIDSSSKFNALSGDEQSDLIIQHYYMENYQKVLKKRIAAYKDKSST